MAYLTRTTDFMCGLLAPFSRNTITKPKIHNYLHREAQFVNTVSIFTHITTSTKAVSVEVFADLRLVVAWKTFLHLLAVVAKHTLDKR